MDSFRIDVHTQGHCYGLKYIFAERNWWKKWKILTQISPIWAEKMYHNICL
jgi:hypothetical protein